ncbi:MAG: LysR family transcriptional regulator [Tistrella sp.]|nr:LysR family transcriptional regulator [Tistrella sp.]MAD36601.1 LysR family transcriptional regulator [Tistrella sp.]MBA75708.1 LysR family transcriptional regulator [Tistrella sp.]
MDHNGFDLNLIAAFQALMAERNVTRAARRIGLTQPAMSAALARLRRATGDELFVRSPKGLAPTPRALDLARPFGQILETVDIALDHRPGFDPVSASTRVTLALSEHPAHRLLPGLGRRLAAAAPGIDLQVLGFQGREDAIRLLDEAVADLAVGVPPGPEARILSAPLFTEAFVCIARKGGPAEAALADLPSFLDARHLLVSPEGDGFGVVDQALQAQGLRRRVGLMLPQMYAAPAIIAETDLVATLMAGVVAGARPDLAVSAPPLALPAIPFHLLWHRRTDDHPAQRWLRQQVIEVAAEPAQDEVLLF